MGTSPKLSEEEQLRLQEYLKSRQDQKVGTPGNWRTMDNRSSPPMDPWAAQNKAADIPIGGIGPLRSMPDDEGEGQNERPDIPQIEISNPRVIADDEPAADINGGYGTFSGPNVGPPRSAMMPPKQEEQENPYIQDIPTPDSNPNRQKLMDYLRSRMTRDNAPENRPGYAEEQLGAAGAEDSGYNRNNMAGLLVNSAAMAGTSFGKKADTSGMDAFVKNQNQASKQFYDRIAAARPKPTGYKPDNAALTGILGLEQMGAKEKESGQERAFKHAEGLLRDKAALERTKNLATKNAAGLTPYQQITIDRAKSKDKAIAGKDQGNREEKYGKASKSIKDTLGAIGEVERLLGSKLEEINFKGGKAYGKDGKELDPGGFNMPSLFGIGGGRGRIPPIPFAGEKQHEESAIASAFNAAIGAVYAAKIHELAGSAQTKQEMKKIEEMFESGGFHSDAETLAALLRYQKRTKELLTEVQGGYSPETVGNVEGRRVGNPVIGGEKSNLPPTRVIKGKTYRLQPNGKYL